MKVCKEDDESAALECISAVPWACLQVRGLRE